MERAAMKAAAIQLDYFLQFDRLNPEEKSPQDFVTVVDKLSEQIIIEELALEFPDYGFIGEESGVINPLAERKFVIDPLDGTVNFMKGIPFFCISIALAEFQSLKELESTEQIEAALIYSPVSQELFFAEKAQGAFLGDKPLRYDPSQERIICSIGNKNYDPLILSEDLRLMISNISHKRFFGAAALELAYVAAQKIDLFLHCSLNSWDMAAAVLILKESGAKVESLAEDSFVFKHKNIIAY